jgi:putative PEP-CTERM system TPR-repeat lipoprotein
MLPKSPMPHLGLADAYLAAGKPEDALRSLRQALAISPQLLVAQQKVMSLEMAAGRPSAAIAIARTVQSQRPTKAVGYALEAEAEATQKNWTRATALYRTAMQKEPESLGVAEKLHASLVAGGKRGEADAFAARWMTEHAQDAGFRFYLGNVAVEDKNYAAAEAKFREVIKLQPDNPLALNNLAWTLAQLGKPEALGYAERANKVLPDQPPFMDTWAMILAQRGELPKAIELQQKAVSMRPNNYGMRLALAKMYLTKGDKAQARKELDEIARAGDKFPGQDEIKRLRSEL